MMLSRISNNKAKSLASGIKSYIYTLMQQKKKQKSLSKSKQKLTIKLQVVNENKLLFAIFDESTYIHTNI